MMELLVDYLRECSGYYHVDHLVRRPDHSVAAELIGDKWRTYPTSNEFREYMYSCGRGLPSLACERDLTNPGSFLSGDTHTIH